MVALLEADTYLIRKKVLKIIGEDFHIYTDDSQTELLGFCNKKAFKLKEDIRIYTDEEKTTHQGTRYFGFHKSNLRYSRCTVWFESRFLQTKGDEVLVQRYVHIARSA